MKVIHILHHSISPFAGQYPDRDALHYNSGFPMQFARETRKRYPDAEIECWRPERTIRTEYRWRDDAYRINHRVFPSAFLRYGWELSLPMLKAARQYIRTGEWSFFVHGSYNLHAYCLAWVLTGAPAILQSHGGLPAVARMHMNRRPWLKPLFLPLALLERLTLPRYRHIFAVNRQEQREIEQWFPGSAVSFSPVGIDFDLFSPGDKGASRARLGIAPEAQVVLFAGRLAPEKGISHLLKAVADLAPRHPLLALYLVGSGPLEQALRAESQALGIQEHVCFAGYVDRLSLPDWYRAADVACLPSLFEGFPMTAAEAMACGTPVVATQAGGAEDVVREFECGILTRPRDASALGAAIAQVLNDSQNHSAPNIPRARDLLDWSAKLQRANGLFQDMAQANTNRSAGLS